MTTAFVLSGGGSLGAAQVGMLAALEEAGVRPDLVTGTSVGALNGAWIAGRADGSDIDELAGLWRSLRRDDVFPTRPLCGLLGLVGRRNHFISASGIRRLLREHLHFELLEEAPIPLHVVATDVLTGDDVLLSRGNAADAVLASAAVPGVLAPVRIDGRDLADGGVVNNTPISHAVDLGADTIFVLTTGYSCALTAPPSSALAMALHAVSLVIHQRLAGDVERYEHRVDLRVVPLLCPITVAPSDFSHAGELIERAYLATRDWFAAGPPASGQAALLEPHGHGVVPDGRPLRLAPAGSGAERESAAAAAGSVAS
jgi:NTE family protein